MIPAVSEYSIHDVQRTLGLSRGMIRSLIESRYVTPKLGPHRSYRFSFSDLVVMRTAHDLIAAKVPARRVSRALKGLRAQLPEEPPLAALRVRALGDRVVVQDGTTQWDAGTGQYVLDFSVSTQGTNLRMLPTARPSADPAEDWFTRACELEERDDPAAIGAYERAIEADPGFADSYVNLGRLLQEHRRLREAEAVYRNGMRQCPSEALLRYNLGVLLEEMRQPQAALQAYREALALQTDLADCHYNIALLYEAAGQPRAALRHLNTYRRLQSR
jgi:tetratricopeptide (TPR) repeat protein